MGHISGNWGCLAEKKIPNTKLSFIIQWDCASIGQLCSIPITRTYFCTEEKNCQNFYAGRSGATRGCGAKVVRTGAPSFCN